MTRFHNTNAGVYTAGIQFAARVAALRGTRVKPTVAIATAATEFCITPTVVREATTFAKAVDAITMNTGNAAKEIMLSDHPRLPVEVILQISRVHRDRQRFAIAQAAAGRDPLGKPPPGTDPPFDTHNPAEVLSRLARNAGAVAAVADGLLNTPVAEWPAPEKLTAMLDLANTIRRQARRMKALVSMVQIRSAKEVRRPHHRAARRPIGTFVPKGAIGAVARAAGVTAKNLRDLPRVLRDTPPTPSEKAELAARLQHLDAAAGRLVAILVAGDRDARTGPSEVPGTYAVFFTLAVPMRLKIGALGTFDFPGGIYGYVGGAFGGGGVRKRTHRHLTRHSKNKKWNIDHLKPHCVPVSLWWTHDRDKVEFDWAAILGAMPGASVPAHGFGSNDNPAARAHLVRFARLPSFAEFERRVEEHVPGHAPLSRGTIRGWRGTGWPDRV